jgi:hypothetical protein
MSNLTLAIDDELLRSARVKAVQRGTSVNEICREAIERFAADGTGDDFLRELRAVAQRGRRRAAADAGPAVAEGRSARNSHMDAVLGERLPTLLGRR